MHMYECVILRTIKCIMGHGWKQCLYFTKSVKNVNNLYITRVKVGSILAYAAPPVTVYRATRFGTFFHTGGRTI